MLYQDEDIGSQWCGAAATLIVTHDNDRSYCSLLKPDS